MFLLIAYLSTKLIFLVKNRWYTFIVGWAIFISLPFAANYDLILIMKFLF